MEKEAVEKAGEKYERGKRYNRWGSNPGSIRIGEEKVPVGPTGGYIGICERRKIILAAS